MGPDRVRGGTRLRPVVGLALVSQIPRAQGAARRRHGRQHGASGDTLVPDGMGGGFHVDYLLLTLRGVVVIDLRDVRGNIFGGDQMAEWTVMDGPHRFT